MASSSKSEQSYVCSSLLANPPLRDDGRGLHNYRPIALQTQVAPLANGSAKVNIGGANFSGVGGGLAGTEVLAAVKLEVEDVATGKGVEGGRIVCTVSWFVLQKYIALGYYLAHVQTTFSISHIHSAPSAYPNLNNNALDDVQFDLTATVQDTLSHSSLLPKNLSIIPGRKSWLLHLDLVVLSDNGNIYDALFLAAAAALRDTRVPKTRSVEYRARKDLTELSDRLVTDVTMTEQGRSGFETRQPQKTADFELSDYWDEGEPLLCGRSWPLCITMNIVS